MPISLIPQSNTFSLSNSSSECAHICAIYGDYLYVASNNPIKDPYIFIYDVSNPSEPYKKGVFYSSEIYELNRLDNQNINYPTCIYINNDKMIIGTNGEEGVVGEFFVYDLKVNPLIPIFISKSPTIATSSISPVITSVCSNDLYYFSVSNPNQLDNTTLYFLQSKTSPSTFDIKVSEENKISNMILAKDINGRSYLFSAENSALVSNSIATVEILSINPSSQTISYISNANAGYTSFSFYHSLAINGNYLIANGVKDTDNIIDIYDISDPLFPQFLSSTTEAESSSGIIQQSAAIITTALEDTDNIKDIYSIVNPSNPIKQLNNATLYPLLKTISSSQIYNSTFYWTRNQNSIVVSNSYVYITYPEYLQTYYLHCSESIMNTVSEATEIIIADRPPQLKYVQTILVTKDSKITATDASDNKGTFNTIDAQSLSFGPLASGETSETKIIYLNVPSAKAIRNIKLGLAGTGEITFSSNSFGIETRDLLGYNIIPNGYFEGLNTDNLATNIYNISIPNLGENFSQYVYINIKVPSNQAIGDGIVKLTWFFDYA